MRKVPYTHPAFITAFANTCYTRGYTDKQAGSLLDTYIKADLIQNNQVFRDSMVKELEKQAADPFVYNQPPSLFDPAFTPVSQAPTVMLPAFNQTTQLPPITTGGPPINKAFPTPTSGLPQSAPSSSPFTFRPANTTGVPPPITPPPVVPPTIKPPTSLGGLPGGAGGRIPRMKLPGGIGMAALAGASVGGLTNLGILPDSTMGGAAVGGAGGATIGAIGGLLKALATKGRSGIPGALNAPAKQLFGSALRGVGAPMGSGALKGGLLGSIFGGSAGGVQGIRTSDSFLGSYPSLLTSTGRPPWAANGAATPTSGTGNTVAANPFGLPSDILNEVNGYGKGNANTTGPGSAGTPQAAVQNYKEQLTQLDQQINQLESSIPAANNPTTYAQRMQAQPHIDMLKRQRSELSNNITMLENQVGVDKGRMAEFSTQQGALANQGLNTAQGEYRNLQDRLGSNNWLMKLYNHLSGADTQMQRLQPRYDYYNNAVRDAQEVGNLAK